MIPEIGQFCMALALCLAIAQTVLPISGKFLRQPALYAGTKFAARGQFLFLFIAIICLAYSFVVHDF